MSVEMTAAEIACAETLISLALAEDLGEAGDITSQAMLPADLPGHITIGARKPGVAAGLPIVSQVFQRIDPQVQVTLLVPDGTAVEPGQVVAELSGPVRSLLAGERTALNFLTHLSGIATLTSRYVAVISGTRAKIYDTRKTIPGWRLLAKYAVRAGGGCNHRMGLFDAVLIKDNHLAAWKASARINTIAEAVASTRRQVPPGTIVEVEVDTTAQLVDALMGGPHIILLDNMTLKELRAAVHFRDTVESGAELEASGGVNLDTVREIAETGVERISVGALTHSAPQLDFGCDWK